MSGFVQVARKPKKTKKTKYENLTPEELAKNYHNVVRKYKTERCKMGWMSHTFNSCPNGRFCFDAHSEQDIRRDPLKGDATVPLYDRALCQPYLRNRSCPSGKQCKMAHNETEVMYHPRMYKSKGCNKADDCDRDNLCAFVHNGDILTTALRAALFFGGAAKSRAQPHSQAHAEAHEQPTDFHQQHNGAGAYSKPAPVLAGFEPRDPSAPMTGFEDGGGFGAPYSVASSPSLHSMAGGATESFAGLDLGGADATFQQQQQQRMQELQEQHRQGQLLQKQEQEREMREREAADRQRMEQQQQAQEQEQAAARQREQQQAAQQQQAQQERQKQEQAQQQQAQQQQQTAAPPQPSATLRRSVALMLDLLVPQGTGPRLTEEESVALLDVLACSEEGRTGFDSSGNSALLHCVSRCAHELAPLLANRVTVDAENNCGQSPLSIAIEGDDEKMLRALMAAGVNLNFGRGALREAVEEQAYGCVLALAAPGSRANMAARDEEGQTVLTAAVLRGGPEEVLKPLSRNPAAVAAANAQGETPLALAVKLGRLNVVIQLAQGGADVNVVDAQGRTVFMLALEAPAGEAMAELLLEVYKEKLDLAARDKEGVTALALAKKREFHGVVALLKSLGARD